MDDLRSDIRDTAAAAALEIAQEFGALGEYSNRGGAPVSIWMVPEKVIRVHTEILNNRTQVDTESFCVPEQPGFPPVAGPETEDALTYKSESWVVRSVEIDSVGALYTLRCERRCVRGVR